MPLELRDLVGSAERAGLQRAPVGRVGRLLGAGSWSVSHWAREHGCPWGEENVGCAYAAEYGHLAVLQWAREHNCLWDWRTRAGPLQPGTWSIGVGAGAPLPVG